MPKATPRLWATLVTFPPRRRLLRMLFPASGCDRFRDFSHGESDVQLRRPSKLLGLSPDPIEKSEPPDVVLWAANRKHRTEVFRKERGPSRSVGNSIEALCRRSVGALPPGSRPACASAKVKRRCFSKSIMLSAQTPDLFCKTGSFDLTSLDFAESLKLAELVPGCCRHTRRALGPVRSMRLSGTGNCISELVELDSSISTL